MNNAAVTVGLSIAVPEPYAAELTRWRTKIADPVAHLVEPHITVVPPTPVDPARLEEIQEQLRETVKRHSPFEIHLRGTGSFRPLSRVVFVTVAQGISACEILAEDARVGPLHQQLVYPYHPHVTVAHDVPDEALEQVYDGLGDFSARFVARHITLHRQEPDESWSLIEQFGLSATKG